MFEREKQHLFKEIISLKEKLSKSGESIHELNKKILDSEDRVKELKNDLEVGSEILNRSLSVFTIIF